MSLRMISVSRLFAAIIGVALIAVPSGGGGPNASIAQATRWRAYTYKQALAAGLVTRAEFARLKGEPLCGPMPAVVPTAPDDIPADAPTCYRPPEQQGVIFLVQEGPGPGEFPGFFRK